MPTKYQKPEQIPFLKGKDKEAMHSAGTSFYITRVRSDVYDGKPRHVYTITVPSTKKGEPGKEYLLPMNDNAVRLDAADVIERALSEDPSGVGPCKLEWVTANVPGGGVWSIEPAD